MKHNFLSFLEEKKMVVVKWLTREDDDDDDVVQKIVACWHFFFSILLLKGCDMKNIKELFLKVTLVIFLNFNFNYKAHPNHFMPPSIFQ